MSVSENIKKYRKQARLTQKQLAEKIDKKEITVRRYEKGDIIPPIPVIEDIAKALDVSLLQLTESESSQKYWNDSYRAVDILNEFLKNDAVQEDCNYDYNELMFISNVDDIYIFITEMLKMKVAEIKSNIKY